MTVRDKIQEVADRLGIPFDWLYQLIGFETGGTFSVDARNPASGAMGLIQVTNTTARNEFGVADSATLAAKYPDFDSHMDNVVYPYLAKYLPFPTQQSFYMAVFYPKYRDMPSYTEFSPAVQKFNPGIVTVQDYVDRVNRWGKIPKAIPVVAALAVAGVIWWMSRR